MQVNKISNNAASFGMALKITPAAKEALQNTTLETIQKLQKAGEELKDTKFYNLEIGEKLTPRIDSPYANSYLPPFSFDKPDGQFLRVHAVWDGTELDNLRKGNIYLAAIKLENEQAALEAYNKLNNMTSDLDTAVELTKLFDKAAIEEDASEKAASAYKAKVAAAAQELIEKFGGDAHIKI